MRRVKDNLTLTLTLTLTLKLTLPKLEETNAEMRRVKDNLLAYQEV